MNDYARHMIRDGRNPYGSRGGYVTSRDPRRRDRRDRGEYDYMDGRYERDGHYHKGYGEPYRMRGEFEYEKCYDDYDYDEDYGYEEDYRGRDMRGRSRDSRGRYTSRRGGRDYGDDEEYKLTKRDIKDWEEEMENDDGSKHFKYPKEQVEEVARRMGIDPMKYGEDTLWVATNFKYSDGCLTGKKYGVDRIEYYIDGAKEFLEDKDYKGKGEEKLYTYYKCIVEQD